MIGIIVQLALSWMLVWLIRRNDLKVLGLKPTGSRMRDFLFFFFVTAACCASGYFAQIFFAQREWQLNPGVSAALFFEGLWWHIKSVLFEELIFRGVLLYILLQRFGAKAAILISSIAFGIYHWFSYEILGQATTMIVVFLITGAMGLVLAYGYTRTMSLYVPIAIHLGWNFTKGFIFSEGSIGDGLMRPVERGEFRTDNYLIFFLATIFPLVAALLINYLLLRRRPQVNHDSHEKLPDAKLP